MAYPCIDADGGQVATSVEHMSNARLDESLALAQTCCETWQHKSYAERAVIVHKAAALLRARVDEFARLATLEMGKCMDAARGDVLFSADILTYYARHAESFLAPARPHPGAEEAQRDHPAAGVLFCVEPWNFPYYQLARVAGPRLMAGNVLVVKHIGRVSHCAIAFENLLLGAGAPAGAYTNLRISREQSDRVVDDPRIKGVALTGSVPAARSVMVRAGHNLRKAAMQLGGGDAFVAPGDTDQVRNIARANGGGTFNVRQIGRAIRRSIVPQAIAAKFLVRFKTALQALKPGDPMAAKATKDEHFAKPALAQPFAHVDRAVKGGFKMLTGGKRIDRPRSFMKPSMRTDVAPGRPAARDEFFDLAVPFYRVKSEDEAIAQANDPDFGLGGPA